MSTKLQKTKRLTKQVRVKNEWHKHIKVLAATRDLTISKLLDEIFSNYFIEQPDLF